MAYRLNDKGTARLKEFLALHSKQYMPLGKQIAIIENNALYQLGYYGQLTYGLEEHETADGDIHFMVLTKDDFEVI